MIVRPEVRCRRHGVGPPAGICVRRSVAEDLWPKIYGRRSMAEDLWPAVWPLSQPSGLDDVLAVHLDLGLRQRLLRRATGRRTVLDGEGAAVARAADHAAVDLVHV